MKNNAPRLASNTRCTGCMSCVDSCNFGALKAVRFRDGHLYPIWNPDTCIHCGKCEIVCPAVNDFVYGKTDGQSNPYAAWANEDELRLKSASGGVFAAVAVKILADGGCVVGALMEGFKVRHCIIDRIEDLHLLQNSKYLQGDLTGIYRAVLKRLRSGQKVFFSGTGCQVGALYSFLGKKNYKGQLFTADLICGGFPSILPLRSFLRNEPYDVKDLTWRDKEQGWYDNKRNKITSYKLSIVTSSGKKVKYDQDIVYQSFSSHLLNRPSCLDCRFVGPCRRSDMTLGDFWGDREFPKEHEKGLSLVIVHSEEGERLLRESDITYHAVTWKSFLKRNFRMVNGRFRFLNLHPARIWASYFFAHCSYEMLKHLYNVTSPSIIWYPYYLYGRILSRLSRIGNNRKIDKIIRQQDHV